VRLVGPAWPRSRGRPRKRTDLIRSTGLGQPPTGQQFGQPGPTGGVGGGGGGGAGGRGGLGWGHGPGKFGMAPAPSG